VLVVPELIVSQLVCILLAEGRSFIPIVFVVIDSVNLCEWILYYTNAIILFIWQSVNYLAFDLLLLTLYIAAAKERERKTTNVICSARSMALLDSNNMVTNTYMVLCTVQHSIEEWGFFTNKSQDCFLVLNASHTATTLGSGSPRNCSFYNSHLNANHYRNALLYNSAGFFKL